MCIKWGFAASERAHCFANLQAQTATRLTLQLKGIHVSPLVLVSGWAIHEFSQYDLRARLQCGGDEDWRAISGLS